MNILNMFTSAVVVGVLALLVIVVFAALTLISWRRVVKTNETHIVQSSRKTVVYGSESSEGNVYYEYPSWIPLLGVMVTKYQGSVFNIQLANYEAYDIGRLPFVVDVTAFFRISDHQTAAKRITNMEVLNEQLKSVLQGAVRRVLATNELQQILQDRSNLGKQFTDEVDSQLREWGVTTVKLIEFMDIRDSSGSKVIENMMAAEKSRIEKESRIAVAANMQEAQTKEIETQRIVSINKTEAEREISEATAAATKLAGIAREQAEQEIQSEQKITRGLVMEVQMVERTKTAEIEQQVATINAKRDQDIQTIQAETNRKIMITNAEAKQTAMDLEAKANLNRVTKEAEGIAATGKAKAESESAMLMAPVTAQVTLAKEIGENDGYQNYLIKVKTIEAQENVGKVQAEALKGADVKIIANTGEVSTGVNNVMDVFSAKGGTSLAGMVEAFTQSDIGKNIVNKITDGALTNSMKSSTLDK